MRGPFQRTVINNVAGPGSRASSMWTRIWYTQNKPYAKPLPYFFYGCTVNEESYWQMGADVYHGFSDPSQDGADPYYDRTYAKAYDSFKNSVTETASLAVNLAEKKQTADMLSKRVNQLVRFTKSLRRFDFLGAARALGLKPNMEKSRWVRVGKNDRIYRLHVGRRSIDLKPHTKALGNNWLEYHFGWEPIVKDVYTTIEVLHEPVFENSRRLVVGRASFQDPVPTVPPWSPDTVRRFQYKSRVKIAAYVSVTNTNLYNLNRLGLVNPALVAWELVPFSFIVDWFTNLSSVLSSYTDWVGLSITDSYTSHLAIVNEFVYRGEGGVEKRVATANSAFHRRKLGVAPPPLVFRELKLPSVARGLTAAALLSGLLGRGL